MIPLFTLLLAAAWAAFGAAQEYPEISREALLGDQSGYWASARHFDTQAPAQVREYHFELSVALAPVGGLVRRTLLTNGISPGPLIEANVGDTITVHVLNSMPNATAVHWHGVRQVNTNFMDGAAGFTQCAIPPGASFTYSFAAVDSGTYWWHSHYELQYSDGLYGGLIVHAKDDAAKVPAYDDDLLVLTGDVYNTPTPALSWRFFTGLFRPYALTEPMPDGGHINGVSQAACAPAPSRPGAPATPTPLVPLPPPDPNRPIFAATNECGDHPTTYWPISAEADKTYRLRLVNVGTHNDMIFSIDNHTLTVIEIDATPVEPYATSRVRIAVGQRASVLVHTDKPGAHWVRSVLGLNQMAYVGPGVSNTTLAVLRYGDGVATDAMPSLSADEAAQSTGGFVYGDGGGAPPGDPEQPTWSDKAPAVGPFTIYRPVGAPPAPPSTQTVYTELGVAVVPDGARITVNNMSWTPHEGGPPALAAIQAGQEVGNASGRGTQFNIVNTDAGAVIDVIIQTPFGAAHPFHLHGHNFWVLAQGMGKFEGTTNQIQTEGAMYRDVAVVPASKTGAYLVLRFRADNPGIWPFHCHMQWHMMFGLLFTLESLPDVVRGWDMPGRELCAYGH